MSTEATKKPFTVEEYDRMAEAGVLPERPRTELVEGEILEMSSTGVAHAMAITRANRRSMSFANLPEGFTTSHFG